MTARRCQCGRFVSTWGPPDEECSRCRIRQRDEAYQIQQRDALNKRLDKFLSPKHENGCDCMSCRPWTY